MKSFDLFLVTSNIDELISELEQKPLPSQEDVEFLKTSQQQILQKTQGSHSLKLLFKRDRKIVLHYCFITFKGLLHIKL